MLDITKCPGEKDNFICSLRNICYRFIAKKDYWQSYFAEMPYDKDKEECEYFLNSKKEK